MQAQKVNTRKLNFKYIESNCTALTASALERRRQQTRPDRQWPRFCTQSSPRRSKRNRNCAIPASRSPDSASSASWLLKKVKKKKYKVQVKEIWMTKTKLQR